MQVMLGPADAVDARFFGGGTWNGVGGGGHLPSKSPLDADDARFLAPAKRKST